MTAQGYILPTSTVALPEGLDVTQFIQTVITGVSGLPGPMVRPKWQTEPPKQPHIDVNWISFGIEDAEPDANGYLNEVNGSTISQRHEKLEIVCDVFGTGALETCGYIRDGFQVPQNRYALSNNNMAFVNVTNARRVPELVNERFINRRVMSIFLRRQIQRIYSVQTLISVTGVIHTVLGNEEYLRSFNATAP